MTIIDRIGFQGVFACELPGALLAWMTSTSLMADETNGMKRHRFSSLKDMKICSDVTPIS